MPVQKNGRVQVTASAAKKHMLFRWAEYEMKSTPTVEDEWSANPGVPLEDQAIIPSGYSRMIVPKPSYR